MVGMANHRRILISILRQAQDERVRREERAYGMPVEEVTLQSQ